MASVVARYMPQVGQSLQRPAETIYDETTGLLKYVQDNTIQPWIDLTYGGYKNFRDGEGIIPQALRPRPSRKGYRDSEENKVP